MIRKIKINGIGCSLVDNLYSPVDFNSKAYKKWSSRKTEGSGIITGGLVFGEDLEKLSDKKYNTILKELTGGEVSPKKNIGGPAIVALVNIAQLLDNKDFGISFYGARGNDKNGQYINNKILSLGINTENYQIVEGFTPFTDVLSDPAYNNGNGERTFINYIGAAGNIKASDFSDSFFDADILIYGGTALTPVLHEDLGFLLRRGKKAGCLNFINTVYDFRSQKNNADRPWPFVNYFEDFKLIDLIIADYEEAIRITGKHSKKDAVSFFLENGVKAGIITHGAEQIVCFSNGEFFKEREVFFMPVSETAGRKIRQSENNTVGDTTGCGDNFAGGVYASTVLQLQKQLNDKPSLRKAAILGIVSGGFAGLYNGGVYYEKEKGEKLTKLQILITEYEKQTGTVYA